MIISHKLKFIFIKPAKVAGTSVEIALSKYCGPEDIISKLGDYSKDSDDDFYYNPGQNDNKFKSHSTPKEIKTIISPQIWNNYYKITIVRNPWDMAVSRYFWNNWRRQQRRKHKEKKMFIKKILKNILNPRAYLSLLKIYKDNKYEKNSKYFLKKFKKEWTNNKFYFDKKGNPICDFYIRYENLEEDYKKVCKYLGIPYKKLPRLKTKQRTEKKHYSVYYDEKSRKHIAKICKREIEYFNYKFEKKINEL